MPDAVNGKKMTAVAITGTVRIYNATSRLIQLEGEALKQGIDLRHTIISNLDDPDNPSNQPALPSRACPLST